MRSGFICILVALLNRRLLPAEASQVLLTANPSSIKDGLTKTLQMGCSLQARDHKFKNTNETCDLTVHSITITRDDKTTIASISALHPAVASADVETLLASGHLAPSEDSSYLQLTWTKPATSQSGIYTCEINTTDSSGQNVVYKSNIYVCYQRPNEEDIIQYITDLENRLSQTQLAAERCERSLKEEIGDIRTVVHNSQSHLQGQIDNLRTVGVNNNAALQRLETGASSLGADVTAIQNTLGTYVMEEGVFNFGQSVNFQAAGQYNTRHRIVYVKFTKTFSKLPTVICNLQAMDADKGTNTRFRYYIRDLTTDGFNLHCETWWDTVLHGIDVKWTATIP